MNKLTFFLMLFSIVSVSAHQTETADISQTELRLNPEIETANETADIDYSDYPFIKLNNNKIELNGDDWSGLAEKFEACREGKGKFNVIYLGDSHIQADFGGNVLRHRLYSASRSSGRGIIIPFRLAGTNQPNDYRINISGTSTSSKLMRKPWETEMPFTGIAIRPQSTEFTIDIKSPEPTRRIRIHSRGSLPEIESVRADGEDVGFISTIDSYGLRIIDIAEAATEFSIEASGDKNIVFGGFELTNDSIGTAVHSIGNNGATYSAYATTDRFGSELSALTPDLVIIALGTNEAFGNTTAATIQNDIDVLLSSIRNHSPETKILLVGPTECYRKIYRRRNGRRRAVTVINTKTADMARAIRLFAEKEGIPYYNHYAVAGSAAKMKSAGILARDGVHFSAKGYRLWGNLLSDALLKQLQK